MSELKRVQINADYLQLNLKFCFDRSYSETRGGEGPKKGKDGTRGGQCLFLESGPETAERDGTGRLKKTKRRLTRGEVGNISTSPACQRFAVNGRAVLSKYKRNAKKKMLLPSPVPPSFSFSCSA